MVRSSHPKTKENDGSTIWAVKTTYWALFGFMSLGLSQMIIHPNPKIQLFIPWIFIIGWVYGMGKLVEQLTKLIKKDS